MASAPPPREDLFIFDAARALAALAVLAAHARSLVLLDAADQPSLSIAGRIFMASTSLGHQAVVVFFVVSGALITRSLLRMQAGVWSLPDFAVARLSRLLVVLIPCLLLGALEDHLGLVGAGQTYGLPGMSAAVVTDRLGVGTLLGNLAFLQGLIVPVFGSNVPLWTLSVEAWCYAGAFCAFALLRVAQQPVQAVGCIGAFGFATLFVLTPAFWQLAPLWGTGGAASLFLPGVNQRRDKLASHPGSRRRLAWATEGRLRPVAVVAVAGAVLAARSVGDRHQAVADYALALIAAWAFVVLSRWLPRPTIAVRVIRRAAGFSYSLYLSHFPLLALCAGTVLQGHRLPLGAAGLAIAGFMSVVALGQAVILWALFERHTGSVRDVLLSRRRGFGLRHTHEFAP